jgi:hypothetical protein
VARKGIFRNLNDPDTKVADFSYQNDSLAQLIVEAWVDLNFQNDLTTGTPAARAGKAKTALADRGIYLQHPLVITEAEYDAAYHMPDPNGVVFVLPNKARTGTFPAHQSLLETAKLLMACVPNGI